MRQRHRFSSVLGIPLTLTLLFSAGCGVASDEAVGAKTDPPPASPNILRLMPEAISQASLVTHPVIRSTFQRHLDFPGTVTPNEHAVAEITTLVRGRVVEVYADLGQEVQPGSLLALLYSKDLGLAQSAYLKANAKLYVAERAYERAQSLLREKVIGLAEAQRREGEMISARAAAREARDRLLLLGMQPEEIQRLEQEQKIRSYVPITAPFAGRVIARNLTKGEVVETSETLFVVADLSTVWVLAKIPEKDVSFVPDEHSPLGDSVEVRLGAYPDEVFYGRLTYVGDVVEATTRTMNLRLELPNPDRRVKPEMFATIRIYSEPEPDVLMVPESAVQRDRDQPFVFVQRDAQTFERRDIRLGESNGELIKVLEGLREGERVVAHGAFTLKSHLFGEQV